MLKHRIKRAFGGFRRDERGTALVELAISLPFALLVFGMIIEGSRMLWAYQSAAAGVRDATRYLARIVPRDICTSGGLSRAIPRNSRESCATVPAAPRCFPTALPSIR
ncbi:TadE/TadG family type IV pilus assembly protein [Falsihalocynthiibacter arcticus]|uniref:TadE-like domain-containing protein n=1 Tax=Falsihalocynthiibacter arcticus TaxID=1579316 RepID=A0A126V2L1_9RHOB|nr:TadE/TadG family type IV pilus assembly protein [Falsihalocynthiibacter arcticus]AML52377.1 hypothetical protein RC74_14810 [Falsihalocynthiibacter arcticus]